MTPVTSLTSRVSACLVVFSIIAICAGWFTAAAITGTAAAINLLVGTHLNKY